MEYVILITVCIISKSNAISCDGCDLCNIAAGNMANHLIFGLLLFTCQCVGRVCIVLQWVVFRIGDIIETSTTLNKNV